MCVLVTHNNTSTHLHTPTSHINTLVHTPTHLVHLHPQTSIYLPRTISHNYVYTPTRQHPYTTSIQHSYLPTLYLTPLSPTIQKNPPTTTHPLLYTPLPTHTCIHIRNISLHNVNPPLPPIRAGPPYTQTGRPLRAPNCQGAPRAMFFLLYTYNFILLSSFFNCTKQFT